LPVARHPQPVTTPRVQLFGVEHGCGDLEAMSRNPFMKYRGRLLPRCKNIFAFGYRPPHPPRTREVFRWASIINAAILGWRNHGFHIVHRSRNMKMSLHVVDSAI